VGLRVKRFADRGQVVRSKFREVLREIFDRAGRIDLVEYVEELRVKKRPVVLLFLGPNGHGKTTTIAKVAKLLMDRGITVVVAASDTFRAGAIEQVEEHCRRLGIRVIKHRYGADPAAVAYDAILHARSKGIDVVLIDTAGRMQTDVDLMEEMRKIARVTEPDLKIFVGDALTGNDALDEARKFNEYVGIDCSILTKVDADAKGGAALSIVFATGRPIAYVGTGQGYSDIMKFDPEWFIEKIVGKG
ncbi:MAG: signal recognition particle-docking protein FtsY, partial [Thermoprotei archaeon]